MKLPLIILLSTVLAVPLLGQSTLVNTRLQTDQFIEKDDLLTLDLADYFQFYPESGPVATFSITKPVALGLDTFSVSSIDGEGNPIEVEVRVMRYELADGGSYDDPYAVTADEFRWTEETIDFALFPAEAPITVANFMTYVADGAYEQTIIHRNESTGRVFAPGGTATFNPFPIIQAGAYRLYVPPAPEPAEEVEGEGDVAEEGESTADPSEEPPVPAEEETPAEDQPVLEIIPNRGPIVFEETRDNTAGTLAMARTNALDSATSQFFVNLEDNSGRFRPASAYSVFGALTDPEAALPILTDFANAPVYDLSSPWESGAPNIFAGLPFSRIPLYAPDPFAQSSYSRISAITVSEGDPEGVGYSWEWVDDDEEVSEEEAANRAAFDIRIEEGQLKISRNNTGVVRIRVIGTDTVTGATTEEGAPVSVAFAFSLVAFNERALQQFPNSTIEQDGWLDNDWYGWVRADDFPEIFHANHGFQFVDFSNDSTSLNAFDRRLQMWIRTSAAVYPYIFLQTIDKWVFYLEGTGDGVSEDRWFYLYDGDNSDWYRGSQLREAFPSDDPPSTF